MSAPLRPLTAAAATVAVFTASPPLVIAVITVVLRMAGWITDAQLSLGMHWAADYLAAATPVLLIIGGVLLIRRGKT